MRGTITPERGELNLEKNVFPCIEVAVKYLKNK